jgi:lysozyme
MKLSDAGTAFIKGYETLHLTANLLSNVGGIPVYEIGYGHTTRFGSPMVYEDMQITQEQADAVLIKDLLPLEHFTQHYVTAALNQNQYDALISFGRSANIGALRAIVRSVELNKSGLAGIPAQMMTYNQIDGVPNDALTARRTAETELFNTGV